jgi:hypothetical protein
MCLRGVFWHWMAMNRAPVAAIACGRLKARRMAVNLARGLSVSGRAALRR